MRVRQQVLQWIYPALMKAGSFLGAAEKIRVNKGMVAPAASIFDLEIALIGGGTLALNSIRGKWILLVNTASDCGYTAQLAALQELADTYSDKLVVIGFPANDFKEQEKSDNETIAIFCQKNFGVTFPLVQKTQVVPGENQHPVYQWLTQQSLNGWNNKVPEWNFSKYLVTPEGFLTHYFPPSVSPTDPMITRQLVTNSQ